MSTLVIGIENNNHYTAEINIEYDHLKDKLSITTNNGKIVAISHPALKYVDVSRILYVYVYSGNRI